MWTLSCLWLYRSFCNDCNILRVLFYTFFQGVGRLILFTWLRDQDVYFKVNMRWKLGLYSEFLMANYMTIFNCTSKTVSPIAIKMFTSRRINILLWHLFWWNDIWWCVKWLPLKFLTVTRWFHRPTRRCASNKKALLDGKVCSLFHTIKINIEWQNSNLSTIFTPSDNVDYVCYFYVLK